MFSLEMLFPPHFFSSKKAACCSVVSYCTFKFSKHELQRTPPFFSHWRVRLYVVRIIVVEQKWVHTLNQSRRFGRLYACCISPTQVFNKMIWFIPLEVNNFGHGSAAWCVIWETLSEVLWGRYHHRCMKYYMIGFFCGYNTWLWAFC